MYPLHARLLLQAPSFPRCSLFIATRIKVGTTDTDQAIRVLGMRVELDCLLEMLDGDLWLACKRLQPAAAFPTPDKSRIASERSVNKGAGVTQLASHRMHSTSSGEHHRIIGVEDARAVAEQ